MAQWRELTARQHDELEAWLHELPHRVRTLADKFKVGELYQMSCGCQCIVAGYDEMANGQIYLTVGVIWDNLPDHLIRCIPPDELILWEPGMTPLPCSLLT
jgi:hypothetical protein